MKQERREVRTADGRRVVFHVAGPETGPTVFFHPGTPGSPYLYVGMIEACVERGLRIVSIARPGYSGSTRLPGRTYADSSTDTAVVADALGAERFYVTGHSGGGPPALADAAQLGDRVRAAAVASMLAPRVAMGPDWWIDLEDANGDEMRAVQAGELTLRRLLKPWAEEMRDVTSGRAITGHADFGRFYSSVDRACFVGDFLDFQLESYWRIHKGIDGWIDDDFALFGDWGFELSQIEVPVFVWQGHRDNIVPAAHADWLMESVPGVERRPRPEEGHVSLIAKRYGEILDDLIERGG